MRLTYYYIRDPSALKVARPRARNVRYGVLSSGLSMGRDTRESLRRPAATA